MKNRSTSQRVMRKTNNVLSRAAWANAACVVQALEPRQLLSAVNVFPIPTADPTSWAGSQSHIVADAKGNHWFTDATDNSIGEVSPAGVVTMFPLPALAASSDSYGQSPVDIVVGPDKNIWFTENGADAIGRITADGTIAEFHTPTADSNPLGLAVGADGNLWFAESNGNAIGEITAAGKITEHKVNSLDLSSLDGMVGGPDGKVWFIAYDNDGNSVLASVNTTGHVTSFPLTDDPTSLAVGSDGNLWIGTDTGNIDRVGVDGTVTTFAIPDTGSVNTIVAGADGNLYFSLDGSNQLGRITTAGAISEFTFPADPAQNAAGAIDMAGLTQDADGTIWFVDQTNPQVGTVNLSNALLATSADVTVTAGVSTSSTFATFHDFAGPTDPAAYTATIAVNGTVLDATIAANSDGGFDVVAGNDWAPGNFVFVVTITDKTDPTRIATATGSVIANAPPVTGAGMDITATSGQDFNGTVASFTGLAMNALSSYSATIDWGDGHNTAGTITANAAGGVDISGSHAYADAGSFAITTSLYPYPSGGYFYPGGPLIGVASPGIKIGTLLGAATGGTTTPITSAPGKGGGTLIPVDPPVPIHVNGGTGYGIVTSKATVNAGVMDGSGFSVQAKSTAPFAGNVASFVLADPGADVSHFHATITWADSGVRDWNTLSTPVTDGVITSDGQGNLTVSTTANFTNSGLFHFTVTISDDRLAAGSGAVGVAYGQLIVDSPSVWFPIYQNGGPSAIGFLGGGVLYANAASASGKSVAVNPVLSENVTATAAPIKALAGQTFKGKVGLLHGVIAGAKHFADLHGTIHWGDGSTSAASFTKANGAVAIVGDHTYAQSGANAVTVDVTQSLYAKGKPTTSYPLILPNIDSNAVVTGIADRHHTPRFIPGNDITIAAGATFSGTLATVPLSTVPSVGTRSVSINWGDGTKSEGSLSDSTDAALVITGSHVYRKRGKYSVSAIVSQIDPALTSRHVKPVVIARVKLTATVTA